MKILLVGSGGREHALAWALAKSPLLTKLYVAPGNAGIADVAQLVPIAATDFEGLKNFALREKIDFAVIAADAQLVGGLWDVLEGAGIKALGPSKAAAVLEGSKGFVKDLCIEKGIPTAAYKRFHEPQSAKSYAASLGFPVVIKADGLAAGKGVIIAADKADMEKAIDFMFEGGFGDSGHEIVVEEFMEGEEASFFALSDGVNVIPLAGAQDHKRAFDGDTGPNTGGMGAYSPAPVLTQALERQAMEQFIKPTVAAFAERGLGYVGVLYLGLMITRNGPKLVEYNCRFGDPEAQVLLPRLKSDLLAALLAARDGTLDKIRLEWRDEVAMTVVMASGGYPGTYEKGHVISGLAEAAALPGITIFHAGTEKREGKIVAAGGRVLDITATGKDVAEARARAYAAVEKISWKGSFYRRDIGWRALGAVMRTILAFLIAPLSMFAFLPLLYLSTGWQAFRNLSEAYLAAMGSLVIIYPAMLVIGLPLYLVLRRKGWVSWWSCGAVGYITSVLASFLLSLFFALQNWSGGEPAALAFVNVTRFFTNPGLLFQPTNVLAIGIGLVFWLIADFRRVRA